MRSTTRCSGRGWWTCSSGCSCSRCSRRPGSASGLVVLIISIVACTIDRTPRLWRQSSEIRVVQPDPFYDPKLPDRAHMAGVDAPAVAAVLKRHRFVVREETADGSTYLYGDRHRWVKMATLLTHAGLVLFLVAAAVTSRFGDEQGLVVAEGESLTVQPIGTPGPAPRPEPGVRGAGLPRDRAGERLHDAPRRVPRRAAGRREDDPRERPTRGRTGTRSTRTASGRPRTWSSVTRRAGRCGRGPSR